MTRTELYDLACTKWKSPAIVQMGDEYLVGEWVSLGEYNAALCMFLSGDKQGVRVHGRGSSWDEAAKAAGLDPNVAPPVLARKERVCGTVGCNEPRTDGAFCPKCFDEHRDDREIHSPPPPSLE